MSFAAKESSLEARLYQDEEHHLTSPFGCIVSVQESEEGKDKEELYDYSGDYLRVQPYVGLYFYLSGKLSGTRVQGPRIHLVNLVFRN